MAGMFENSTAEQLEEIAAALIGQGYRIDQIEAFARRGGIKGIERQLEDEQNEIEEEILYQDVLQREEEEEREAETRLAQ